MRLQNDTATFEDSLAVSYKIKHRIMLLGMYPKELKTYIYIKNMCENVDSSFVHKFPNQEETIMFCCR